MSVDRLEWRPLLARLIVASYRVNFPQRLGTFIRFVISYWPPNFNTQTNSFLQVSRTYSNSFL